MLVGKTKTNASPFHFRGLADKQKESETVNYQKQENNRERIFRRTANACELAAGVTLNSTIVFTFHALQIHPMGLFLAVGVSHFYFTATAVGEKSFSVAMVGAATSLSCLCALSEPISEYWEAHVTISSANETLKHLYHKQQNLPDWCSGLAITLALLGIRVALFRLFTKR